MGNSAKAAVFWGYCWKEGQLFDTSMGELAEAVLTERGIANPYASAPEDSEDREAYNAWWEANRTKLEAWYTALHEAEEQIPFVWETYGSIDDDPTPYLAIRATRTLADWEEPGALAMPPTGDDWKEQLDAFLAGQRIEPPDGENQPGWWVVAEWS